jgi:hypothetical protein
MGDRGRRIISEAGPKHKNKALSEKQKEQKAWLMW